MNADIFFEQEFILQNEEDDVRDSIYFSFIKEEWPHIKSTIFKQFI